MKRILIASVMFCVMSVPASAGTILFSLGTGGGSIFSIDTDTNDLTLVGGGFVGVSGWAELAIDSDGNLFGLSSASLGATLYAIEPGSGPPQWTQVGSTGLTFGLSGLAFGEDNRLYAAGSSGFYEIDTDTGEASVVGMVDPFFNALFGDIVHAGGSTFYATSLAPCGGGTGSCLWSIDANTGEGTIIGPTGINFMNGLAYTDGMLFGFSQNTMLYSLDVLNGSATLALDFANLGPVTGGASAPVSTIPLPAGLPLLFSAFVALGWLGLGKRERASC